MNARIDDILNDLADDIIYHGWLVQWLESSEGDPVPLDEQLRRLLTELLASRKVEVGIAKQATPGYLEFVAWKGSVDERVTRALAAVSQANGNDKSFAYWLCLRRNIDRFEE